MQRVRCAADVALALAVALCLSSLPAATEPLGRGIALAATVAWPVSTLVVSEVQTGGASASDEFVEIANQGAGPVDLIGLEVVYATSSGSTVTRKATWSASTIVPPGRRILLANGAGSYVGLGDATYTGGFAATGGAIALRVVGGTVIDAVGWGDATSAFVEGSPIAAPPASSSIERRPGGVGGNTTDTNDNATDWFISTAPNAQNLASPAVPGTTPTPTPTASATPTPISTPTATPTATPTPTPVPTSTPDATPSPSATPTGTPTPEPTPTIEPTPTPELTPSPTPNPSPSPSITSIAEARTMPDGSVVTISGALTTDLGALESARAAFIQDASGGIAIYLDAAVASVLARGTAIVVRGSVDERFAQRTLRAAESDVLTVGPGAMPSPFGAGTGAATEGLEGRLLRVSGAITAGPDALADGTAVTIDDGSGPLRVIVTPSALASRELAVGSVVTAVGPLGQRDSTGTGAAGYRLFVVAPEDLSIEPAPTPTPSPSPTPTPTPTASPTPTSTPGPTSTPAPTPSPSGPTIAAARALPVGTTVTVRGVVIAEPGRLGTPSLFAIADPSAGIVVKLPSGVTPPPRGRAVAVTGTLADPYGQTEIRPAVSGLTFEGTEALPSPIDLPSSGLSEATEARVVRLTGTALARPSKSTSGDITLLVETSTGAEVRIQADGSSGLTQTSFVKGARYRLVGIGGQRASRKGELDGYRVWVRDSRDVTLLAPGPTPSPSGGPSGSSATPGSNITVVPIASALRTTDRNVAIEAIVTAGPSLLDSSGRRIVVQDASAAIEILLPKDGGAPAIGTRIRAVGKVGQAYGAPRLRADTIERRGSGPAPAPLRVQGPLRATHVWRLVTATGRVDSVHKLGERWRAEIAVGSQMLVVVGQPGAGIPNTALAEGRIGEVTGIVRAAYPSASDERPSILPRSAADVHQTDAAASAHTGASSLAGIAPSADATATGLQAPTDAIDADLADLESVLGTTVRVGGLVVDVRADGFTLDDGTATAPIILIGEATSLLGLVEPSDAVNVTGRVERHVDDGLAVIVDDPAGVVLGSSLGGSAAIDPSPSPSAMPSATPDEVRTAAFVDPTSLPGAGAGVAALLAIAMASVGMSVLRRRQGRRLLAVRVAARLEALAGVPADVREADGTTTRLRSVD